MRKALAADLGGPSPPRPGGSDAAGWGARWQAHTLAILALSPLLATCAASPPRPTDQLVALSKPPPGPGVTQEASFRPLDAIAAPLDEGERAYRAAVLAREAGDLGRAVEHLAWVLAASEHPLRPWAAVDLGRALLDSDPEAAKRLLTGEVLAGLGRWPGAREARWLAAEAALRAGDEGEARSRFEALIAETPTRLLATTRAWAWAEHLAADADPSRRVEALRLFRRMEVGSPQRRSGRLAGERADALWRALPPTRRSRVPKVTPEEQLALGRGERRRRHYGDAADALEDAVQAHLAAGDLTGECLARLELGRTLERARRRQEAAEVLEALLGRGCGDEDVLAQARFLAGRDRARSGSPEAGRGHYQALVDAWPDHRLADDAALKAALLATRDDPDQRRARLAAVADAFPAGDMRGEARFQAVLLALEGGSPGEALRLVDAGLAAGDPEEGEDLRGRLAYWRGRLLAELGRREEAVQALTALTSSHPLGYYGQRALTLLDELAPPAGAKLRAWVGEGLIWSEGDDLTFPPDGVLDEPGFRRGLALVRIGLPERGRRELLRLASRSEIGLDPKDPKRRFLLASLILESGDPVAATRLLRASFPSAPPAGAARSLWRLAYPRAWAPEIEEAAEGASVPAALVRAIAREESGFAPEVVSSAKAYGLLQIIRPTARPIARELGLPSGPSALRRPEVNLRIGATLLARLLERYKPQPGVVPAAYNAGAGAADRWLAEGGADRPFDLWVESIPYDETRRYTRRVLQSWGIYSLLDEGRLPRVPATVP